MNRGQKLSNDVTTRERQNQKSASHRRWSGQRNIKVTAGGAERKREQESDRYCNHEVAPLEIDPLMFRFMAKSVTRKPKVIVQTRNAPWKKGGPGDGKPDVRQNRPIPNPRSRLIMNFFTGPGRYLW